MSLGDLVSHGHQVHHVGIEAQHQIGGNYLKIEEILRANESIARGICSFGFPRDGTKLR